MVKKPKIAILSGGDELIKQCDKNPKKIANNYALVVAGLASELGAEAEMAGIMPDALEKVTAKISEALAKSDVVVTIGGSSVGVKDFVPDAVNALGKPGVVVQGVFVATGCNLRFWHSERQTRGYAARAHWLMHCWILPFRCTLNQPLPWVRRRWNASEIEC